MSSGPSAAVFEPLALQLLQRDWLSANHIVFAAHGEVPATVVDTGYARHSALTQALIAQALDGQPLQRIVNTHLHSDHCGGNHALQAAGRVQTLVPAASFDAVQQWDANRLTYELTGQHCPRFEVDGMLQPGQTLALGPARWQVLAAPGHDPDAILLFEPQTRTLISGDALWQDRLAIIFPELDDAPGFGATRETLAMIESLHPRWVLPGHGEAFDDVAGALAASRRRLDGFEAHPERHTRHAARALVMFHMMEHRERDQAALLAWLQRTPIFMTMARRLAGAAGAPVWAADLLSALVDDGLLLREDHQLRLAESP